MEVVEEMRSTAAVSPVGQYFNTSKLSLSIIVVLELEVLIDHSQFMPWLSNVFLPIHPRYSSIMVTDKKGSRVWKRVEVNLQNHIKTPTFSSSKTSPQHLLYDDELHEYLSQVSGQRFMETQPMWEVHVVNYPTTASLSTLIFNLHHALGDGFSLMGALLSTFHRADDPSLPLTFLAARKPPVLVTPNKLSSLFVGFKDFCWSTLKSTVMPDAISPIRSGRADLNPAISISSLTFRHSDIKQIQTNLHEQGVTVNDVVVGIIFLGCELYMEESVRGYNYNERSLSKSSRTAIVLVNMRDVSSYQPVSEMLKPDSKAPWGNRFSTLHVPLPKSTAPKSASSSSDPLHFVTYVHRTITKKRASSSTYLNRWLLRTVTKFRGPEGGAKLVRAKIKNSSILVTNMIGPKEHMAFANHPVKGFYFMLAGCPQSLIFGIMTYMGKLRISIGAEKEFIDTEKIHGCIQSAFEMMLKAATQVP